MPNSLLDLAEPILDSAPSVAKGLMGMAEPIDDKPNLMGMAESADGKSSLMSMARPANVRRVKRDYAGNIVDAREDEEGIDVPDLESYQAEQKKPTNYGQVIKSAASGLWENLVKPAAKGVGKLAISSTPIGSARSLMEMAEDPNATTTSEREGLGLVEGGAEAVRNWYDIGKSVMPAIADKITKGIDLARGFDYKQADQFEREREYGRYLDRVVTEKEREKAPNILSHVGVKPENIDKDVAVVGNVVLDPTNFISAGIPVSKAIKAIATPLSKIPLVGGAVNKVARTIASPTAMALETAAAPAKQLGRLAEKVTPAMERLAKTPLGNAAATGLGAYEGYEQGGLPGAVAGAVVGSATLPLLGRVPKLASELSQTLIPLAETAEGTAKAIRGGTGRVAGFGTATNEAVSPTAREALAVAGGALPAEEATRRARALGFAARGIRPAAPFIDSVLHGAGVGAVFGSASSGGDPEGTIAGALQGMGFGLIGSGAGALLNSVNKARLGFSPLEVSNYVRQQVMRLPEAERQEVLTRLKNDPGKFETIVPNLEFIEMVRGVGGKNVDVQLLSDEQYRAEVAKALNMNPTDPQLKTQGVTVDQAGGRPRILINLDRGDASAHELLHAQEQLLNIIDPSGKVKAAGGLRDSYTAFQSGLLERFTDADLVRHWNEYNRKLQGPGWQDVSTITDAEKTKIHQELAADANDRFNMLATALYGIGPDSRRRFARWAAATPVDKIADTISMAYAARKPGMKMPDESVLFTDSVGATLRSNARELKNLGNLWTEQGKVLERLSHGTESLEGGTKIVTRSDQVEELTRSLTNYAEALKNGSHDEVTRAEQPLNEAIATGVFATRPKDAGTIYKEAQIRARLRHGRDQVTQAEVDAERANVNPVELVNKRNFPLKPGEEPRLASAKERKQAAENQFSALSAALTPVTKQFATKEEAMKNARGELVSYPTADGTMVFEGPHLSAAQLDVVMAIPDIVFPAENKVNLEALNGEAMTGSPRPVEMTYYGAVKNSGNLPRSRREIHPNGFYLSKAENFVTKAFDRGSLARDVEREAGKPVGASRYLEPFRKPSEPTYADALDRFHEAFNRINANHAAGVPGAVGLDPDARRATQLRDAVNGMLGVAPAEINPLASGNNYYKSFRVDRAYNLRAGDEMTGKPDYIRAKANFMPEGEKLPKIQLETAEYLDGPRKEYFYIEPKGERSLPFRSEREAKEDLARRFPELVGQPGNKRPMLGFINDDFEVSMTAVTSDNTTHENRNLSGDGEAWRLGKDGTIYWWLKKPSEDLQSELVSKLKEKGLIVNGRQEIIVPSISHKFQKNKDQVYPHSIAHGADFMPEAQRREPAPAVHIGDMDFTDVGEGKLPLFNLTRNVPAPEGHPEGVEGSTVSPDFLKAAGFDRPAGYEGQFMPSTQPDGSPNPDFYSCLERAVNESQQETMSRDQALSLVRKSTNAEELKWTGIEDQIEELAKQGKISKADLVKHLQDEGAVRFEEVKIGAKLPSRDELIKRIEEDFKKDPQMEDFSKREIRDMAIENADELIAEGGTGPYTVPGETKYTQYQLPGGENYREVVLSMPVQLDLNILNKVSVEEMSRPYNELSQSDQNHIRNMVASRAKEGSSLPGAYTSSHFPDVPNYVAHMRLNERPDGAGKPGLFIEEIQSDRHQQGREKGYKEGGKFEVLNKKSRESVGKFDSESDAKSAVRNGGGDLYYVDLKEESNQGKIPDAPFRTTWPVQMFKRALRDAVASGKDWVGWTSGETQADRYDLSKQIDQIRATKRGNDDFVLKVYKDGLEVVDKRSISAKGLEETVGKELAKKIVDQAVETPAKATDFSGWVDLKGVDLKVGGEGMKGFYDQILPSEVGKYVKKWGGRVERAGLNGETAGKFESPEAITARFEEEHGDNMFEWDPDVVDEFNGLIDQAENRKEPKGSGEKGSTSIWKMNITPEMRDSVAKGQPLFMPSTGDVINKVRSQLQEKAPQALSELDSLLGQLNLPESPALYQQALDSFSKPEKLRNEGGAEGVKSSTNLFTNQNEEDIKPLQKLYADNVWRLNLLSRERYDEQLTTTGLMPTLDFTPATTEYLGIPAPDPELAVKQPSMILGKLEETRLTNNLIPEGRTLTELGLPNDELKVEHLPLLDAYFGDGNWVLKRGDNSGAGEGVWFADKLKASPELLGQINAFSRRVRSKLFLQRTYDVAGATSAERAAGKTIVPGETRVHITADQAGNAKVIPYASWVKGEWVPRVIRTPELRQAEEVALAAVNALPANQRPGTMFGVDVIPLKDGGYGAVELNPSQLYAAGDKMGAQSSGYLIDNALVQDAYIAGLQGKLPVHAKLARLLLAIRGKELAAQAGKPAPRAYRPDARADRKGEVTPTLGETPSPAIPMGGAETSSGSLEVPL